MRSLFTTGNLKLPRSTLIFNMTPACECPSDKKKLCKVSKECYAKKAERIYKQCLPFRKRQQEWWKNCTEEAFVKAVLTYRKIDTIRLNESGDFPDQESVEKTSNIAKELKKYGIKMYTYTARSDLEFRHVDFKLRGSGFDGCPSGQTIMIRKNEEVPKGFVLCPGSCKTCTMCRDTNLNIAFREH